MNEYAEYTASDFIDMIDAKFEKYAGKIDRVHVKWGMWSREMNMEITRRLSADDPDSDNLRLVFSYWIVVSQLLDLIYNYRGVRRFLLGKKITNKAEEVMHIREDFYGSN